MRPLVGALVAGLLLLPTPAGGQTIATQHPPPEIEGYPGGGGWTEWRAVFREQGHQYGKYSKVWESLDPRSVPRWTDPAPVAGTTPIRAVHVTELRDAVVALA
jgi:hypothetical protein